LVGKEDEKEKKLRFESLKVKLKVSDCPEPSDIIWENLQNTPEDIRWRECAVILIMIAVLTITTLFFTWIKVETSENQLKYPKNIVCSSVHSLFGQAEPNGNILFTPE
jgi:hypothetical protein